MCGRYYLNEERLWEIGALLSGWNRGTAYPGSGLTVAGVPGGADTFGRAGVPGGADTFGRAGVPGRADIPGAAGRAAVFAPGGPSPDHAGAVQTAEKRGGQKETAREVSPGSLAPVLLWDGNGFLLAEKRWGFTGREKNSLLFNARAESALERPAFRDSMEKRRCLVPASGFYEWNRNREKFTFTNPGGGGLLFAGCFQAGEPQDEFTILTTAAGPFMRPVHDRMPLVLEPQQAKAWLTDRKKAEELLRGPFPELEKRTDYEQLCLSFF